MEVINAIEDIKEIERLIKGRRSVPPNVRTNIPLENKKTLRVPYRREGYPDDLAERIWYITRYLPTRIVPGKNIKHFQVLVLEILWQGIRAVFRKNPGEEERYQKWLKAKEVMGKLKNGL